MKTHFLTLPIPAGVVSQLSYVVMGFKRWRLSCAHGLFADVGGVAAKVVQIFIQDVPGLNSWSIAGEPTTGGVTTFLTFGRGLSPSTSIVAVTGEAHMAQALPDVWLSKDATVFIQGRDFEAGTTFVRFSLYLETED